MDSAQPGMNPVVSLSAIPLSLISSTPELDVDDFRDAVSSLERPQNVASATARILENAAAIITCITEGKSVTAANKKRIIDFAKSIIESTRIISVSPAVDRNNSANISSASTEIIQQTIREEISKAFKEQTPIAPTLSRQSYAEATKQPPKTPVRHASKPSIIVTSKKETKSKDEVLQEWRNSISFRNTSYAPARIQPVSNNKIRVEFDNVQQQEETLRRLNEPGSLVSAEPAKRLRPMVELKGIYKDTMSENVTDMIKAQNESIRSLITTEGDIVLRFLRRNKNDKLYNAVLMVTPSIHKQLLELSSINIDHQRIQLVDFVPLLQCYKCLQFGHTQKRCESETSACSHCGKADHRYADCTLKTKVPQTCFNCSEHNRKYRTSKSTDHGATSQLCSIHKQMTDKIILRTDYGY